MIFYSPARSFYYCQSLYASCLDGSLYEADKNFPAPLSVSVFRRCDAELLFEAFAEIVGVGDSYPV